MELCQQPLELDLSRHSVRTAYERALDIWLTFHEGPIAPDTLAAEDHLRKDFQLGEQECRHIMFRAMCDIHELINVV